MFVDNLLIFPFRTEGKLKLLQDERAVKKTLARLCAALANQVQVHLRTPKGSCQNRVVSSLLCFSENLTPY